MECRFLNETDSEQLEGLFEHIESKLPDPTWWPPVRPEVREHFFDRDWIRFIGCFDEGRLVAAAGLFIEPSTFSGSAEAAGLDPSRTVEIGRCMVRLSRRGDNTMLSLSHQLVDYARALGREWIIGAVHPDNAAGCKSLEQLGMKKRGSVIQEGVYPRSIYAMPL